MSEFQKVLVVDDGDRSDDRALSAELAELGYASVTTSFEAAADVLAAIPPPAAIVLHLPRHPERERYSAFLDLAERLRRDDATAGIPIVMVEGRLAAGGPAAYQLQSELGAQVFAKPEH